MFVFVSLMDLMASSCYLDLFSDSHYGIDWWSCCIVFKYVMKDDDLLRKSTPILIVIVSIWAYYFSTVEASNIYDVDDEESKDESKWFESITIRRVSISMTKCKLVQFRFFVSLCFEICKFSASCFVLFPTDVIDTDVIMIPGMVILHHYVSLQTSVLMR